MSIREIFVRGTFYGTLSCRKHNAINGLGKKKFYRESQGRVFKYIPERMLPLRCGGDMILKTE
jgi:hypothetical protein